MHLKISVRIYLPFFIWNDVSPCGSVVYKSVSWGENMKKYRAELKYNSANCTILKMDWLVVKNHFEDLHIRG